MTRAILTCFHKYTPFGGEFYEPMLDFYLQNMKRYEDEYDKIYLLDSTWNIDPKKIEGMKAEIIKINPSLRYYDAYKEFLPEVKEDLVLFMDDDMVVYRKGVIARTFSLLIDPKQSWDMDFISNTPYDVVSIYDTIGEKIYSELNGKSKFCPYWFATRRELLMKYRDCEWGPNMPEHETLGKLTEKMLADTIQCYEYEEDKSNILIDGIQNGEKSKDLGYYHVRSGSVPAYLLATKEYGNRDTFLDYLLNQPKNEYLRQCAWYQYMGGNPEDIFEDILIYNDIGYLPWTVYFNNFINYHGL